ncbi:MAG TPA: sugar ABC transporter permease [Solirubrobacteraceae bacterium]|nr:sugar ABC transporter permease [Solirubrobacteraceae bacterium]
MKRRRPSETTAAALMVAPYMLGLVLLLVLPAGVTFALSLTEYDLLSSPSFTGLSNFGDLLDDPSFRAALPATLAFLALAVPLRVFGALALALALHRRTRAAAVQRGMVFLPTVVPDVAIALLWLFLINPLYGPMAALLSGAGLPVPDLLTDPTGALLLVVLMSAFAIGEGFVIALAVRRELPEELYELARVEGASTGFTFRRLTLPLMAPTLSLLAIRDIALSLQFAFVPALLVTGGGPDRATTFLPLLVYRNAFENGRYGYAAAITVVSFAMTLVIVATQVRILRRGRFALQ